MTKGLSLKYGTGPNQARRGEGEETESKRKGEGEGEEKGYHVYFLVSSTWEIHQKVIDGDSCYGSTTRTTEVNANENEQQFNSLVPKH